MIQRENFVSYRLKELLLKERSERGALQSRVEELEERCRNAAERSEQLRSQEKHHREALRELQGAVSQQEAIRLKQQTDEVNIYMKCIQYCHNPTILRVYYILSVSFILQLSFSVLLR